MINAATPTTAVQHQLASVLLAVAVTVLAAFSLYLGLQVVFVPSANTRAITLVAPTLPLVTQIVPPLHMAAVEPNTILPPEVDIAAESAADTAALAAPSSDGIIRTPVIPRTQIFAAWQAQLAAHPVAASLGACAPDGGTVVLAIFVLAEDHINDVALTKSSGCAVLDHYAMTLVQNEAALFIPATEGGHPVGAWYTLPPLHFTAAATEESRQE